MMAGPSLAELRGKVFKHSAGGQEIGSWFARRVGRPSAVFGTWIAVRLGLSANAVTVLSLASALLGSAAIGSGSRAGFAVGVVALHLAYWLDHVDGQVARWRGTQSLSGVYFDYLMHHVQGMALGFALGFGLAARSGHLAWAAAGCPIAVGWTLLSLHNDCRYKAFFQRLKREDHTFRVEGGGAERPTPPAPWPRRGRGVITWPLQKACEPHAVLGVLSILAILSVVASPIWAISWRIVASFHAIVAPLLATARAARAIRNRQPDRDFDRWFQPWELSQERPARDP